MRFTTFALRLCRWPMKCQRNRLAVGCVLGLEVLRAVLAHDVDSSLGQCGHVVDGDVLRGGEIVTSGPTSSRTRASRAAICSADEAKDALCPARPAGAALAEEEVGPASRTEVEPIDGARSGIERSLLGCGPEVELAPGDDSISETRPVRARDLLPPRSSTGRSSARRRRRNRGRGSLLRIQRSRRASPASRRAGRRARVLSHSCEPWRSTRSRRRERASGSPAHPSRARHPGRRGSRPRRDSTTVESSGAERQVLLLPRRPRAQAAVVSSTRSTSSLVRRPRLRQRTGPRSRCQRAPKTTS